jgi:hypothetical protein
MEKKPFTSSLNICPEPEAKRCGVRGNEPPPPKLHPIVPSRFVDMSFEDDVNVFPSGFSFMRGVIVDGYVVLKYLW